MDIVLLDAPRSSNMHYRRVDPFEEHDNEEIFFEKYQFYNRDIDVIERMLSRLLPDGGFEPWWIPKRTQILMAIRYLSTNSFQSAVGDKFGVTDVVARFIRFYPDSEQWCAERAAEFAQQCKFSNIIGAIDGSLVKVQRPRTHGWQYQSRKACTAVNMVAITDARGRFLYIDCRFPGRCHDSAIWTRSDGSRLFEDGHAAPGYSLLGDSGSRNSSSVVTPYRDAAARAEERKAAFNLEHSHTRIVVEQAFGALKRRFPLLYNGTS
ncbi:hypothetical protein ANCCAN_13133 [Ancylostoma caninum]|uniref:DDE Tnp4 domain-containing protein n=1 Tax=Ancylostoma caninum TaxID=29170 RepID=A0A368G969_ANCCA|nr:hypothetical protein ANCCAN_13133 [Ancylostoma caninum]